MVWCLVIELVTGMPPLRIYIKAAVPLNLSLAFIPSFSSCHYCHSPSPTHFMNVWLARWPGELWYNQREDGPIFVGKQNPRVGQESSCQPLTSRLLVNAILTERSLMNKLLCHCDHLRWHGCVEVDFTLLSSAHVIRATAFTCKIGVLLLVSFLFVLEKITFPCPVSAKSLSKSLLEDYITHEHRTYRIAHKHSLCFTVAQWPWHLINWVIGEDPFGYGRKTATQI